jgi:Protein of unknown function (DUF3179)
VWESTVEGRTLHFHLAGINNQNFIMRDEETGSWWQQVSGEAILGPLKGNRLELVSHDELSFGLWKSEKPQGRVLRPDESVAAAGRYAPADWEERIGKMAVVTKPTDQRLEPRALIVGVSLNGAAKAYPISVLERQSPIIDTVGGVPFLLVIGDDKKSVRAFETAVDGRMLEFFAKPGASPPRLVDAATGTEWDFTGKATSGPLTGRQLRKTAILKDYWFDWKTYHPDTNVYQPSER